MSARRPQRSPAVVSNYRALNTTFYAEEPWRYFERRLVHLAQVAQDPVAAMAERSLTIGAVTIDVSTAPEAESHYPTPAQSFLAMESEVLLHHSAETLLRLLHAHCGADPCPLMRLSELRSFSSFKAWVRALTTSSTELETVARAAFAAPLDDPALTATREWVAVLAHHFLESAPYNAAKHGMTLAGGAEQRTVELDGVWISNAKGASVNWLELWPPDGPDQEWTKASRLLSVEAFLAMIQASNLLMQAIWARGRHEHLPDVYSDGEGALGIPTPQETFRLLGVDAHVLSRWFEPLVSDGEKSSIHIQIPMAEVIRAFPEERSVDDD